MTCPNCHAEVGAGKKFCGKCGAPVRSTAALQIGTLPSQRQCPECGAVVQPGKRFCGRCGSALSGETLTAQPSQGILAASAPSPPPPLVSSAGAEAVSPPTEIEPCPHCGAPLRAAGKFCKQCGKSSAEPAQRVATSAAAARPAYEAPRPPIASQPPEQAPGPAEFTVAVITPHEAPPPPITSRPPEPAPTATAFFAAQVPASQAPRPPIVSAPPLPLPIQSPAAGKGASLAVRAGLSVVLLAGMAIGYVLMHRRAASRQANHSHAAAVNPVGSQSVATTPPGRPQGASQTSSQTPASPSEVQNPSQTQSQNAAENPIQTQSSAGGGGPATPPSLKPKPQHVAPTLGPAHPRYQQAHDKALRAFAVERYIEPSEDNALSWTRRAGELGDPQAPQIEREILSRMAQKVQQARAVRNYDLSVTILTKLAVLYPDHPELQRLCTSAQQEQQEYARQVQRQQQRR